MKIEDLSIFVDVVKHESFSTVADIRNMSPSSVSRVISRLEEQINVNLFYRNTRSIKLTEAGTVFYEKIYGSLNEIESAAIYVQNTVNNIEGKVKITTSPSFGISYLSHRLDKLYERYPKLAIELILSDNIIDITSEKIDLAIRHGTLADSTLISKPFFYTEYYACASPKYIAQYGFPTAPDKLSKHNCFAINSINFTSCWNFKHGIEGDDELVAIKSTLQANNGLLLKQSAIDGIGIALLPGWLVQDAIDDNRLIRFFSEYRLTTTKSNASINFVYPTRNYQPKSIKAIVDFLIAHH